MGEQYSASIALCLYLGQERVPTVRNHISI